MMLINSINSLFQWQQFKLFVCIAHLIIVGFNFFVFFVLDICSHSVNNLLICFSKLSKKFSYFCYSENPASSLAECSLRLKPLMHNWNLKFWKICQKKVYAFVLFYSDKYAQRETLQWVLKFITPLIGQEYFCSSIQISTIYK